MNMSMKKIENASTATSNAKRGSVYTTHTNKFIEHLPNKPTTTRIRNTNSVVEKAETRTFYFENFLKAESVHI